MKWLYYDKKEKNLQNKKKGRFRYRAAVGESNMDFSGLFSMQGMLFTIMILGYLFRKTGMITDAGKGLLTDLVLFVTLPASIIKSFEIEFNHQILLSCLVIIIVATAIQAGALAAGPASFIRVSRMNARKCFSTPPSAPMQAFWEIPLQRVCSVDWDFCMRLFIPFPSVPSCGLSD